MHNHFSAHGASEDITYLDDRLPRYPERKIRVLFFGGRLHTFGRQAPSSFTKFQVFQFSVPHCGSGQLVQQSEDVCLVCQSPLGGHGGHVVSWAGRGCIDGGCLLWDVINGSCFEPQRGFTCSFRLDEPELHAALDRHPQRGGGGERGCHGLGLPERGLRGFEVGATRRSFCVLRRFCPRAHAAPATQSKEASCFFCAPLAVFLHRGGFTS